MTQLAMFDMCRVHDPESSRDAARRMVDTGQKKKHEELILSVMDRPMTMKEIAAKCRLDYVQVGRRLAGMVRAGMLADAGMTICRQSGRKSKTWRRIK